MLKFNWILILLNLLISAILGADGEEKPKEGAEGTETGEKDLKKTLDTEIEKMDELLKAKSNVDYDELAKSEEGKKAMAAALKKAEAEEKKPEESEMKKGFEAAVEENDELIDAVPVLKSFGEVLGNVVDMMDELKAEISTLQKSQETTNELQKSFNEITKTSTELIKSFSEEVEEIGSQPQEVKGEIKKGDILEKSFGEDGKLKSILPPVKVMKNALLKSVQEGEIEAGEVSKWEMGRYDPNLLSEETIQIASKHFPKMEVN